MKKLLLLFVASLFLSSCSKDEEIEQMELHSFTVQQNMNGDHVELTVSVQGTNIYDNVRLYAYISGNGLDERPELVREGPMFINDDIVFYNTDIPSGNYDVRLYVDEGSGAYQTTLQETVFIDWEDDDEDPLEPIEIDVQSVSESMSAEVTIDYENAIDGSLLRVNILHLSTIIFASDYELSPEGTIPVSLDGLTPDQEYVVKITGVPSANDYPGLLVEHSFQTEASAPGTLAASLSQAFNIHPNSARTTITFVNTTGSPVNATILALGSESGEQSMVITLPETSFDDMEIQVSELSPNESVEISIVVDGSSLDTTMFSTQLVEYSQVSLELEGAGALSPNMNSVNFADLHFTGNGLTNAGQMTLRFKSNSDLIDVWEVLLILGQPGNNVSVGSQASWQNLGDGWYEISLVIDTPIVGMGNSIPAFVSTKDYSFSESVSFQVSMIITDQQGTEIGTSIERTLAINP